MEYKEYYKVPSWSELYSDYLGYLNNQKELMSILTEFRKNEGIKCELFNVFNGKGGKIAIGIGSKHEDRIAYDMDRIPLKKEKGGMYPIHKGSKIYKRFIKFLKSHDNFEILNEPSIYDYIVFDNNGTSKAKYKKKYIRAGNELYLYIESKTPFIVSEDFIPTTLDHIEFRKQQEGVYDDG